MQFDFYVFLVCKIRQNFNFFIFNLSFLNFLLITDHSNHRNCLNNIQYYIFPSIVCQLSSPLNDISTLGSCVIGKKNKNENWLSPPIIIITQPSWSILLVASACFQRWKISWQICEMPRHTCGYGVCCRCYGMTTNWRGTTTGAGCDHGCVIIITARCATCFVRE